MRVTVHNRGPEAAELHLLPQLWFRNTWSWKAGRAEAVAATGRRRAALRSSIRTLGDYTLYGDGDADAALLRQRDECAGGCSASEATRAISRTRFHDYVVHGDRAAVQPGANGHQGGGALPLERSAARRLGDACGCG